MPTHPLILQLYLGDCASFVVPILGDPLVPAPPDGPSENTLHTLLGGQHETPEEAANLADTQRHPSPREALKALRLPGVEPGVIFLTVAWLVRAPRGGSSTTHRPTGPT